MHEDTGRAVTLADVAAAAQVAASTVSRALSRPERVNRRTRERIERIARELGYEPPRAARAADDPRSRTIAVVVADATNPFYFGIIRGAAREARSAGRTPLLLDTEESGELEDTMLPTLRRSIGGAVLAASRLPDRQLRELGAELPIVTISRQVPEVPSVVMDTPAGCAQALEHLVSLGHLRVAYAAGPSNSWSNERRWRALQRAAARLGVEVLRLGPFASRRSAGAAAADAVLNARVTGCVAFNDLLAIGMLDRLRQRGVEVPAELSIVGCDDIFGADFCDPPLTTLTSPIEQAGRAAVTMLVRRMADPGSEARALTLPTHLTMRASTGPAPSRPAGM